MKHFFYSLLFSLLSQLGFTQSAVAPESTAISPPLIGEKIPNISLSDIPDKKINLPELTAKTPSVLVFYRGGWCPYCNLHLSELQVIESEIMKAD